MLSNRFAVVAAALLLACIAGGAQAAEKSREKRPPAPLGVATYDVYAAGDVVHVLAGYGRKRPAELTLWHRRSADGATWSEPVRVNRDADAVQAPHPGEDPQIAVLGNRLLVAWTGSNPDGGRAGPIATATSTDGGRSWQPGPNPSPGSNRYHALVELEAAFDTFHMVWLHDEQKRQALHYTASKDGGRTWQTRKLLADHTCNCCWNRIAVMPDRGVRVLYRGGEPRDMMLAASPDGQAWRYLGAVGRFGWDFAGCPHVGGALAVSPGGKALHALVWSGHEAHTGLHHLVSNDGGTKWSAPRRLGGDAARNSDLAVAPDGTLTAVWDAIETHGVVYRAQSRDGGATWSAPQRLSDPALHASNPRVVHTPRGFATFWLEAAPGEGARLSMDGKVVEVPPASAARVSRASSPGSQHETHH